jgi:hypothetical protein
MFLGIFLTAAVLAIGYGLSWPLPHQPTDTENSEKSSGENSSENVASAFWHWTTHDPLAFYTAILTLFTGVVGGSTIMLWIEGGRTRRHAEHSFRSLERAYIFSGPDNLVRGVDASSVTINVRNYGRTLGILREVCLGELAEVPGPGSGPKYDPSQVKQFDLVIMPTEPNIILREHVFKISGGVGPKIVAGYVRYIDVSRTIHTSRFLVRLNDGGRADPAGPAEWNEWD